MPPKGGLELPEVVGRKLAVSLGEFAVPYLPSLRALAAQYGVSVPVMSKALHLLARQGLLELHPRKRAVIVAKRLASKERTLRPFDALYAELSEEIRSGDLAAGKPLPKISYLVTSRHVASRTVRSVYERLMREGAVHQRGKMFLVGRPVEESRRISVFHRPVIVVLGRRRNSWTSLCRSARTERFGQAFIREAETQGVRLIEAYVGSEEEDTDSAARLVKTIEDLGNTYRGTLISMIRSEAPDIEVWVHRLLRRQEPVVWLDRNDDGLPAPVHSPHFSRCHYSEDSATYEAIKYLAEFGHSCAAYVMLERGDWQIRRLRALERAARRHGSGFRVVNYTRLSKEEWCNPRQSRVGGELKSLSTSGIAPIAQAMEYFIANKADLIHRFPQYHSQAWADSPYAGIAAVTQFRQSNSGRTDPVLDQALGIVWAGLTLMPGIRAGATALIAPNDNFAASYHLRWLRDARFAVPQDYSIVSFDNLFNDSFFPLTSVDFGFAHLGYQAFHAIMGDVPVARARNGDIPARAKVIDKGSVGMKP